MKILSVTLIFLFCIGCTVHAQNVFNTLVSAQPNGNSSMKNNPDGFAGFGGDSIGHKIECQITPSMREAIQHEIEINQRELILKGILPSASLRTSAVSFIFPMRQKAGVNDPGFYNIGNYIDHDTLPGSVLDYNCGGRTYDGHAGTDIGNSPFEWYKMDNDLVEIIAGAPGIIINKSDGNFDRNCNWSSTNWNAVYIQHSDGTIAWYGHMKNGSLTSKLVGDSVAAGEYLGTVGSSGMSSGPHLHFEVRSPANETIDPWAGTCNSSPSMWTNQEPYFKSTLNKLMTCNAPPVTQCSTDTLNQCLNFCSGDLIYLIATYRDQQAGQVVIHEMIQPNGSIFQQWTQNFNSFASATWYYYNWILPASAQSGTWKYRVNYLGNVYETFFTVDAPPAALDVIGSLELCPLDTTKISAMPGFSYLWSTGNTTNSIEITTAGNYFVQVSDTCGNTSVSDTIVVTEAHSNTSLQLIGDSINCIGDTVQLSAPAGSNYFWSTADTTAQLFISQSGDYSAAYTDTFGCNLQSDTVEITFLSTPQIPFITLIGTTLVASNGYSFQWLLNDTIIQGAVNDSISPNITGTYRVLSIDSNGCSSTSLPFVYINTFVEENLEIGFNLFPNPSSGEITLFLTNRPINFDNNIIITNLLGSIIYSYHITQDPLIIDLSKFESGLYFVHLFDSYGNFLIGKKVIIY